MDFTEFCRAAWMEAFFQRTQRFEAPSDRRTFATRFGAMARRMFA